MRWPFVSRAVMDLALSAKNIEIVSLVRERDYWRTRAERLADAALVKAGAIHEPVMGERKAEKDPLKSAFGGMAVREIDSSKRVAG